MEFNIERMRQRAEAEKPNPCGYKSCSLNVDRHYHLVRRDGPDEVIRYDSPEDHAAFPPDGLRGPIRHSNLFPPFDLPNWDLRPAFAPFRNLLPRVPRA
jgi:hypothetical protein